MIPSILKLLLVWLLLGAGAATTGVAQQPITLEDVPSGLPEITPEEPMSPSYSPERATAYLDRSALNWQKTKNCATCHTNLFYLAARPALTTILPDSGEVRRFYEDYPTVRWPQKSPGKGNFWPVVIAAGLTMNDAQSTGKLSDVARSVLDKMWSVQREDGGWMWPNCDYAPMEIDEHYGVTLAALAVGIAPDRYSETPQAQAGLEKLRRYFRNDPPKSLHHRAMLAWCSVRLDGIATEAQRQETLAELLGRQCEDGGWSTAGFLTDWKGLARKDGQPLDTKTSDGYGTGFVVLIARELGLDADDPRLRRGIEWLHAHQRESGKWFTRSPVNEARNLISNVGSAYAILALQACGELPGGVFGKKRKPTSPDSKQKD
jgi:squalene-hopene/tetraprenyl-beta-curcumene cyclase